MSPDLGTLQIRLPLTDVQRARADLARLVSAMRSCIELIDAGAAEPDILSTIRHRIAFAMPAIRRTPRSEWPVWSGPVATWSGSRRPRPKPSAIAGTGSKFPRR